MAANDPPSQVHNRLVELLSQVNAALDIGDLRTAAPLVQQAQFINKHHAVAVTARMRFEKQVKRPQVVKLIKACLKSHDPSLLAQATSYCIDNLPAETAEEVGRFLLQLESQPFTHSTLTAPSRLEALDDKLDDLTRLVFLNYEPARKLLFKELDGQPYETFLLLFNRGDGGADSLVDAVVNNSVLAYASSHTKIEVVRNMFTCALAQLMEPGLEYPERCLRLISGLLTYEGRFCVGIDSDSFAVILENLDNRLPTKQRTYATLALNELFRLECVQTTRKVSNFVTSLMKTPSADNLIVVFSALDAVFLHKPEVGSSLLLADKFLTDLVEAVQAKPSEDVDLAMLEMFSSACIDKECRRAIGTHCLEMIQEAASKPPAQRNSNLAALALVKLGAYDALNFERATENSCDDTDIGEVLSRFKEALQNGDSGKTKEDALQALSLAARKPAVKELITDDGAFLSVLFGYITEDQKRVNLFGGVTLLKQLCSYRPSQDDDADQMERLRALAAQTTLEEKDPLDDNDCVTARCKKLIDANVGGVLHAAIKNGTAQTRAISMLIFWHLTNAPKHRGPLIQQGVHKLLLQMYEITAPTFPQPGNSADPQDSQSVIPPEPGSLPAYAAGANALARLLIGVRTDLVFGGAISIRDAIRPLASLLPLDKNSSHITYPDGRRDTLPGFEALMALTNLSANANDEKVNQQIADHVCPALIDELMVYGANKFIRQAAAELTCNLCTHGNGAVPYFELNEKDSTEAKKRLSNLLSIAKASDDDRTRQAVGGILALLTNAKSIVAYLLRKEECIPRVLSLCRQPHRLDYHAAIFTISNLIDPAHGNELRTRALFNLKLQNALPVFEELSERLPEGDDKKEAGKILEAMTEGTSASANGA